MKNDRFFGLVNPFRKTVGFKKFKHSIGKDVTNGTRKNLFLGHFFSNYEMRKIM